MLNTLARTVVQFKFRQVLCILNKKAEKQQRQMERKERHGNEGNGNRKEMQSVV